MTPTSRAFASAWLEVVVDRTRTGSGSGSVFSEFGGFGVRFWAKTQSSDGFGVRFSKVRRVRSSVFIGFDPPLPPSIWESI